MWLTDAQQQLWRDYLDMTGRLQAALHRQLQQACGMTLADYDVLVTFPKGAGCGSAISASLSAGSRAGCRISCAGCANAVW